MSNIPDCPLICCDCTQRPASCGFADLPPFDSNAPGHELDANGVDSSCSAAAIAITWLAGIGWALVIVALLWVACGAGR